MPRGKTFTERLGTVVKRDNTRTAVQAKVTIRRNVLDAIGRDQAHVFDAFAGEGHMHAAVWREAASYVGCDKRFIRDDRLAFVADNIRVLRSIDLSPFTIFDCDHHGSPWEQLYVIARRRKLLQAGQRLGVVLTDGAGLTTRFNGMVRAMAMMAGVSPTIAGMSRDDNLDWLFDRAVRGLAGMFGAKVERRWQASAHHGTRVHYIGLVLQGSTTDP